MATQAITIQAGDSNGQVVYQGALTFNGSAPTSPPALNQLSPVGTITSGALPTVQLVSTTAAQVLTTRDVETFTVVTSDASNNAAQVVVALSADNSTFSTILTPAIAAAINNLGAVAWAITVRVPAAWFIKMTTTHATLGVTTFA